MKEKFNHITKAISNITGHPIATLFAFLLFITWLCFGPSTHYSNNWQNIANVIPNIVAFLMLFIINNAQGRDMVALNLKIDELLLADKEADDNFIGAENLSEAELKRVEHELQEQVQKDKQRPGRGEQDMDEENKKHQ